MTASRAQPLGLVSEHADARRAARDAFVGREAELEQLRSEYERTGREGLRIVVVAGPAGVGKTAFLEALVASPDRRRVLRAAADEDEARVPGAVIDQLLRSAPRAERTGTRWASSGPAADGPRLLDAVEREVADGPLAIVVDDIHWSDQASLEALAFVLRRLRAAPVLAILTVRGDDLGACPEPVRRLAAGAAGSLVSLPGLTADELAELGNGLLSRHAAWRLHDHTLGNPRHACALLEEVPAENWADPELPLPAPAAVRLEVERVLESLGSAATGLAEAAAVLGFSSPTHQIFDLAGVDDPLDALEQLCSARVLVLETRHGARRARFVDPMTRAAVYERIGPSRQSRLHLAATALEPDSWPALRHQFLAAQRPHESLAAELARAGHDAARHGAWAGAADAFLCAARASPKPALAQERLLLAVQNMLYAGETPRAQAFGSEIAALAPSPLRDAVLGHLSLRERPSRSTTLLEHAWRQCDDIADPAVAATVAFDNAIRAIVALRGDEALAWSGRAIGLAGPRDPQGGQARATQALALAHLGQVSEGLALLDTWLATPSATGPNRVPARVFRGWLRLVEEDLGGARDDLTEASAAGLRLGSINLGALALSQLARVDFAAGAWAQSVEHARAAVDLQAGNDGLPTAPFALWARIAVPAARGDHDTVGEIAEALARIHAVTAVQVAVTAIVKAEAAQTIGDAPGVLAALAPVLDTALPRSVDVPGLFPWADLYADALLALDRSDEASAFLTPHERLAQLSGRRAVIARLARLRGRIDAARGRDESADAAFRTAVAIAAELERPLERARARLAYGQYLRRRGKRRLAAAHLIAARDDFAALDVRPALELVESELAACGAGLRGIDRGAAGALTPRERSVAALVADGRTNREVAAELFVSVKTVEVHLTRIYAKLGISSRAQLIVQTRHDPDATF